MLLYATSLQAFIALFVYAASVSPLVQLVALAAATSATIIFALWFRDVGFSNAQARVVFGINVLLVFLTGWAYPDTSGALLLFVVLLSFGASIALRFARFAEVAVMLIAVAAALDWIQRDTLPVDAPSAWGLERTEQLLVLAASGMFMSFAGRVMRAQFGLLPGTSLTDVFQHLPAAMLIVDAQQRVLGANAYACSLFRLAEGNLLGKRLDQFQSAGAGGQDPSWLAFQRGDGTQFTGHISMAPHKPGLGNMKLRPVGGVRVVTVSDVTPLVEAHERQQREERVRMAASMAQHFAHEVRNPVAAISGSAQLLSRLGDTSGGKGVLSSEERSQLFDSIVSESERLDGIVERFATVSDQPEDMVHRILQEPEFRARDTKNEAGRLVEVTSAA